MFKKALTGSVVLLAFLVLSLWFLDFDSSKLGRELLTQASNSTGLVFDASRSRLNVMRGIRLEHVVASSSFPSGRYEVVIDRMHFEHRLLPLLRGQLVVERVLLERPRIEVVYGLSLESASPREPRSSGRKRRVERAPPQKAESEASSPRMGLSELVLREGTILVRDARHADQGVSLNGIGVTLVEPKLDSGALTLIHAVRASGRLDASELRLGDTALSGVDAEVSLASGKMDLNGVFRTEHAEFDGSAQVDFNSLPFRHRVSLSGRLRDILAEVSIGVEGFGLEPRNLKGEGLLRFAADAPFWDRPELSGRPRESEEISLRIEHGRIFLESDHLAGSIDLDGRIVLEDF